MSLLSSLLVGCSLSDYCGFNNPIGFHKDPRCWYNIVFKKYSNIQLTNLSYGGSSNLEILHRANNALLKSHYDIVLIQLSSVKRKWFWRDDNPDHFTIFNGGKVHNEQTLEDKKSIQHVCMFYFNTEREVERDLVNLLVLQKQCIITGKKLIIIDGFDFLGITRRMFPELFNQLEKNNLIGYPNYWRSLQKDVADDLLHPGVESNKLYAEQIINHLKKISL